MALIDPVSSSDLAQLPDRSRGAAGTLTDRARAWVLAAATFASSPTFSVLLIYAAVAVFLTSDVWRAPTTRWIGSCCDQEQAMWFLSWIPYVFRHGVDPFVTYQLNAPSGANLLWNASVPLIGVLVAPITVLGGPILAFNVALVGGLILNAWVAFMVLRRYARGTLGPFVGGAVYGFSPYVMARATMHLNLVEAWMLPLFLLLLDEIVVRRRHAAWRLGVGLGVLATCQLLTSEELLAMSVFAAGVLVALLAASRPHDLLSGGRRLAEALFVATLVFLVLAGWPLAVQFLGPLRITGRVQDASSFSTDLLNLIVPTRSQWFAPAAATQLSDHFSGLTHEANAYVGLPLTMVLAAIVARGWNDIRVRTAGLAAAVYFVVSLGPYLHIGGVSTGWPLPWLPLTSVPIVENILPARFAVFMWLAIAVVVTVAVDNGAQRRLRSALPRLATLIVALAVIFPAQVMSSTADVPQFFHHWQQEGLRQDATELVAPFFYDGAGADPMLWAAVAGDEVRMPEAYAYVPLPDGRPNFGPAATQLSTIMEAIQDRGVTIVARGQVRAQVGRDLVAARVTDVIVGPMNARAQMVGFFTDLFGRPPAQTDGVQIWRNVDVHGVAPAT